MLPKLFRVTRTLSRTAVLLPMLCALGLAVAPRADAQTLVQVPFGTTYVGIPASTYNGADGQACTSTNPNYIDFYGDGCPGTQATLSLPAGIAMDSYNNLYIADYNDKLIRVVYQGGTALSALLIAANPKTNFVPIVGSVYPIGGGTASLTSFSGTYYCSNVQNSGAVALDKSGNGCPAFYSYNQARDVAVDRDGNVFLAGVQPFNGVRIVYAGGAAGAKLITTYNPTITAPQVGYIYALSASGDFISIRGMTVDDNENIYGADTGAQAAATGLQATTSGNQIKKFSGTGWTTYILGSTTSTGTGTNGDGGPASAASLNNALGISADHSGNLYFAEGSGRIRVVYNAGSTPPLYVQGNNAVVVTNPVAGNVYTVAGGGTLRTSGSLASSLNIAVSGANLSSFALDNSGNLVFTDSQSTTYGFTWRVDGRTGVAVIIGGDGTKTAAFSAATTPAAGVPCNGATGGPLMTDAFDDGCPATEILPYTPRSTMVFDSAGNFYQAETRTGSTNGIVRKYSYGNQVGQVAVGSTAATALAFTPVLATTLTPTQGYVITGGATSEFSDAGNDLCSTSGTALVQTCVYNTTIKPVLAGPRLGALTLTSAGTNLISAAIGVTGVGALLTLDPATQTTVGTGLSPSGVGVDQAGGAYIGDATTGNVYKSTNGGALVQVGTGYKNPAQITVDNLGDVFVADTGNNRVAVAVNTALTTAEQSAISALTLAGPYGVASDSVGNLYIADTGNNRVLMVTPLGGVSTKAFTGLAAPRGLAVDAAGDIFVADSANARIVELPAATAGIQGAQIALTVSPTIAVPVSVAVDPAGDVYVADSGNQNLVVILAGSTTATTLLGGTTGLTGLAVDTTGNLFVSATSSTGLLSLNRTQISYTFPETNLGQTSTKVLTLTDTGNASLVLGTTLGTGTDATDFTTGIASTNSCTVNQTVVAGQSCSVLATFQPKSKATLQSKVTFASNAANATSATLIGTGVQKVQTTSAITYTTPTGGQPIVGQAVTVTATITPASNVGTLMGTVIFLVDGGSSRTVTVANGAASTTYTFTAGSHAITSAYSGDANYAASNGTLTVVAVSPASTSTALAVTSSGTPANNVPFTLTATVSSPSSQGAITGTVQFMVNGVTPAQTQTVTLAANKAAATFTLPTGNYTISAVYSGSSYYVTSTTTLPVQVIPAGLSTTKLAVTSPTGTISLGQTVVVTGTFATSNATATPTGTVTFTLDGGSAQTFPYSTSQSASFPNLLAGSHTITAAYSGDNAYGPSSASVTITVARATPTATLTITPNVSALGNTYTVTATVSNSFVLPTGTITLSIGGVTQKTVTLVNGAATFTTTTNNFSNFLFSAAYSGDLNFLPLTFTSTPAADFVTVIQTPAVTTPQYGVALDYVSVNSFNGYTGTVQITCAGLPANSVCRSTPTSNTVTANGSTLVQLQVFVNVNPSVAGLRQEDRPSPGRSESAIALALLIGFPLILTRRRFCKHWAGLSLCLLALVAVAGLSGCGSDTREVTNYNTPLGTYPIAVTTTDGTISHTSTLTMTVIAGSPARP